MTNGKIHPKLSRLGNTSSCKMISSAASSSIFAALAMSSCSARKRIQWQSPREDSIFTASYVLSCTAIRKCKQVHSKQRCRKRCDRKIKRLEHCCPSLAASRTEKHISMIIQTGTHHCFRQKREKRCTFDKHVRNTVQSVFHFPFKKKNPHENPVRLEWLSAFQIMLARPRLSFEWVQVNSAKKPSSIKGRIIQSDYWTKADLCWSVLPEVAQDCPWALLTNRPYTLLHKDRA